jgi:hypothetical protein
MLDRRARGIAVVARREKVSNAYDCDDDDRYDAGSWIHQSLYASRQYRGPGLLAVTMVNFGRSDGAGRASFARISISTAPSAAFSMARMTSGGVGTKRSVPRALRP